MANKTGKGGFTKGKSGNPGGRPKTNAEIQELIMKAVPSAIETMIGLMMNKRVDKKVRLAAAKEIADRGLGKAVQSIMHNGKDGGPVQIQVITGVPRAPKDPQPTEGKQP